MERNYFNEGFESFLREKTDEYKLYPSDKVWAQINRKLRPRSRWPFLAAALLLLGIGVGTRYITDDQPGTRPQVEQALPVSGHSELQESRVNDPAAPGSVVQAEPLRSGAPLWVASRNPEVTPAISKPALKALVHSSTPGTESSIVESNAANYVEEEKMQDDLKQQDASPIDLRLAEISASPNSISLLTPEINTPSRLGAFLAQVGKAGKKMSWQMYFAPSFSYRRLEGKASKYSYPYSAFPYSASYGFARNVKDAVRHRPSLGMELGTALIYPLNRRLRLKAGLQLNYNAYQVEAFSYVPELAPFGSAGPGSLSNSVSTTAYYRNFNGFDKTLLKNSHFMVSVPVGVELSVLGNRRVRFNVATTIQPTYIINNQAYLVSTNLKNYAQEPSLYRKWNVNAGAEAFLSVNTGSFNWTIGPQLRYQLMSSYKENYPIREHLMDLRFKIGVVKRLF